MKKDKVCVIGLGYIGLPTAATLASNNFEVYGYDINEDIVETINSGKIHIVEPDLEKCVFNSVKQKKLSAYNEIQSADIFIICVPTPFEIRNSKPEPNIDFIIDATDKISDVIRPGNQVILESTSPVGTTEKIARRFEANNININEIFISYCPERVLPGNIMVELIQNDRIVGGINNQSTIKASKFYNKFVKGEILETNSKTAEMCKLCENSFRDINIAYANELSMICDDEDINPFELIYLANHHPRVNILNPGVGVGGHCISVDPWFLVSSSPNKSKIIRTAREVNNSKPKWVISKIIETTKKVKKKDIKIACLGISFKPDIDDLRESPSLEIVKELISLKYNVSVVEPNIKSYDGIHLISLDQALQDFDIICSFVNHTNFIKRVDEIKSSKKIVLDFCNLIN